MKKKIDIRSTVLGALLGMAIVISIAAAAERGSDWEYKVVVETLLQNKMQETINSHIAQGWQFVATSGVGERSGYVVMRREKEPAR
jgi:hypothetical protein